MIVWGRGRLVTIVYSGSRFFFSLSFVARASCCSSGCSSWVERSRHHVKAEHARCSPRNVRADSYWRAHVAGTLLDTTYYGLCVRISAPDMQQMGLLLLASLQRRDGLQW